VIVDYLNLERITVPEGETHSMLIVYADTVLPRPIARQLFQPVAGWNPQVDYIFGRVD